MLFLLARPGRKAGTPLCSGGVARPSRYHERVNQSAFVVLFMAAVLVLGTAIFFYWRSQYGVWAQNRRRKAQDAQRGDEKVIKYD